MSEQLRDKIARGCSMPEVTKEKLAELRGVAEAATPGPWTTFDDNGEPFSSPPATGAMLVNYGADIGQQMTDVRYIATFDPPTVTALIDALEAKTAELEDAVKEAQMRRSESRDFERERDEARAEASKIEGRAVEFSRQAERAEAQVEALAQTAARNWSLAQKSDARAHRAEAAIERVKALHKPEPFYDEPSKQFCIVCQVSSGVWPCPTIQAIEGEE